ncbi:MAG: type II toxin-antitoxin system Phd/YefM family antitoxin [Egibacteraceae bacterium]
MPTIGIHELSRDTSRVIAEVERTGRPLIVTRDGEPIVALCAIGVDDLEDLALAYAPEFVRDRAEVDAYRCACPRTPTLGNIRPKVGVGGGPAGSRREPATSFAEAVHPRLQHR